MSKIIEPARFSVRLSVRLSVRFSFPHPNRLRIHEPNSEPTFARLKKALTQLNANAVLIHSDFGDGRLGHYYLATASTEYKSKSNGAASYTARTNPGSAPTFPSLTTGPQITDLHHAY